MPEPTHQVMAVAATTRRRFMRDAAVATAAATETLAAPAFGARRRRGTPTVAVFGGGIAGLTAGHELAERGFDVTIYERRAWGGKARSTEVPGSATGDRRPLPGEHAFRGEFGCYRNLDDTMRRIPFGSNPNGVFDNMVGIPHLAFARTEKADLTLSLGSLDPRQYRPAQVIDLIVSLLIEQQIPPAAAAHFANRMAVFFSSCDARRTGQWERTAWTDFSGADRFPDGYRKSLVAFPELAQASKASRTSAKYVAWLYEDWILYPLLGRGTNGKPVLRILNLPTNEAWIEPWLTLLRRLGVRLRLRHELTRFGIRAGRFTGADVRTPRGRRRIVADWYVCALPVERARRLWSPAILAADPSLGDMHKLDTAWMNGIMYYLREPTQIVKGGLGCADSPWKLSFIPQAQFWACDFARTYGDGTVHDKLSVAIADFTAPGFRSGKRADDLTPDELAREVWEDVKRHVNNRGQPPGLTDDMLHSWDVDPGLEMRKGRLTSEDPLVLPTAGTERYRPDVATAIPNLMLCGDYLNGKWEVAHMEAACFNGRRAANAVLDRQGSRETPAATLLPYRPPEWEQFKRADEDAWRRGERNIFDADLAPGQLRAMLGTTS